MPDGRVVLIPRGLIIDGASNPRLLSPLASPTGSLFIPSIVHDYGYGFDSLLIDNDGVIETHNAGAGRKYWDDLMFDMAEAHGQRPAGSISPCGPPCGSLAAWPGGAAASLSRIGFISPRIDGSRFGLWLLLAESE